LWLIRRAPPQKNKMEDEPLLEDKVALNAIQCNVTPADIMKLSSKQRKKFVRDESEKLRRNLRILQAVLGFVELIAAIVLLFVVYFVPYDTTAYTACFYTLFAYPGIFLPITYEITCLSPFILAIIALLAHAIIYRLIVMTFMFFDNYIYDISNGRYDNRFRWIFRAAIHPIYYMIALHVSGVRDFIMITAMCVIWMFAEILRWIAEHKIRYAFSQSELSVVATKNAISALYASTFAGALIVGTQVVCWIVYVLANINDVTYMTWIYGIGFAVLSGLFVVWILFVYMQDSYAYKERMTVEYAWSIYETVTVILLTVGVTVGSILG